MSRSFPITEHRMKRRSKLSNWPPSKKKLIEEQSEAKNGKKFGTGEVEWWFRAKRIRTAEEPRKRKQVRVNSLISGRQFELGFCLTTDMTAHTTCVTQDTCVVKFAFMIRSKVNKHGLKRTSG